jgi:hypothetical protein
MAAQKAAEQKTERQTGRPKFRYQDVPELPETFSDSVGRWYFDGATLRIEFLVSRMDQEKSSEGLSGRKLPVCRLVLTPTGALELLYQAQRMAAAFEKAGLVKKVEDEQAAAAAAS